MIEYYIYGLHRSGTNFFEKVISRNFIGTQLISINTNFHKNWKHSFIGYTTNANDPKFIIYKNIYTWLESILIRNPFDGQHIMDSLKIQDEKKHKEISEINSEYFFCGGLISLERMVEVYIYFYQNYVNSMDKNTYFIKYEDLLVEEKKQIILNKISKIFDLEIFQQEQPKEGEITLSPNYNRKHTQYYLSEKPMFFPKEYSHKIDSIIKDRIIINKYKIQ